MAMRFMRSMRNPSTKAGGTSNTTGSRIRSSARTIRENTVSLVQKARSKVGGAGYAHGTSSDRGLKGSAGQIKQTAANQSRKAGDSLKQTRRNTVSALKSAPSPQAGVRYAAGYKMGTGQAAKNYKANVQANNPGKRTGLESRTLTQATAAIVQGKRAALRGSMAVQTGKQAVVGAKIGSRMPDASMKKVYNAQRYADPSGVNKSVTLKSHTDSLATAAGYGVGKAARRTVQGVNAVQDAPGRAAKAMFSTSRKVAGGLTDAAKNNRLSLNTQNALHNIVRPGIKNAVAGINRGAEKVFMGLGKAVGYAAAAPSLAVYHGGKALVKGVKANLAASARMKATSAAAMASPRMTRATGFGQQGRTTPLGRNSIVQAVRIKNAQSGGVYMGQKKAPKPSFALGQRGAVTATGQNSVVQGVRYQNVVASGMYKGLQRKHPKQSQPQPTPPQSSTVQNKSASTNRSPYLATTHPTRTTGGPSNRTSLFMPAAPSSTLQKTAPWQHSASGSLVKTVRVNKQTSHRIRVASPTVPLPQIKTEKKVLIAGQSWSTGSRAPWGVVTRTHTATGITSSKMSDRISGVVERARAARGGRPATAGQAKFRGPDLMKGDRGVVARSGAREAAKRRIAFHGVPSPGPNSFNLAGETKREKRGRPKKVGK